MNIPEPYASRIADIEAMGQGLEGLTYFGLCEKLHELETLKADIGSYTTQATKALAVARNNIYAAMAAVECAA